MAAVSPRFWPATYTLKRWSLGALWPLYPASVTIRSSAAPMVLSRAGTTTASVCPSSRYTTLLRAVELWGAVRADGPGRLAGDEEPPAVDGFVVGREENFSQQIKANPEDRLSTAFVGLDDDRPVFRLPFTGRVGERKGYGQHSEKLADPVGVNE